MNHLFLNSSSSEKGENSLGLGCFRQKVESEPGFKGNANLGLLKGGPGIEKERACPHRTSART